jgi:hypothetical protein
MMMEWFIHTENLALFKKKLADPHTPEAEREVVRKLLADEQAREVPARPPKGIRPPSRRPLS